MKRRIPRQEIANHPEQFALDPGKTPQSTLSSYTRYHLLPQPILIGTGKGTIGFYAPVHVQMLQTIEALKAEMKYAGIQKQLDSHYHTVFALHDILEVFAIRYLDEQLLHTYLDSHFGGTPYWEEIIAMYRKEMSYPDIKNAVLEMLVEYSEDTAQ